MMLVYSNPQELTIIVTVDEGEIALGDLIGPTVASVPTDPMNRHYAAILAGHLSVAPYTPPSAPNLSGSA